MADEALHKETATVTAPEVEHPISEKQPVPEKDATAIEPQTTTTAVNGNSDVEAAGGVPRPEGWIYRSYFKLPWYASPQTQLV